MIPEDVRSLAVRVINRLRGYGIVVFTRDGRITRWLADATAVTGFVEDEIIGQNIAVIFTEADEAAGIHLQEIETALRLGAAEDARWHRRKDCTLFWASGATLLLQDDGRAFVKIFRDETHIRQAEEHRLLLLNELNHRVKNTLATVQSVAEQTLRSAGVAVEVRRDLANRFIALSRAHNVLVDQNWAGADLVALIAQAISPHDQEPSPFRIQGPRVWLHPSQAVALSLLLHELITNAAKYGALTTPSGCVDVSWNVGADGEGRRSLVLLWQETGGPPVSPPVRRGFGTPLIEKSFSGGEGGARLSYEAGGFRCVLTITLIDE
jgi:PAS domain S-box-containing protein